MSDKFKVSFVSNPEAFETLIKWWEELDNVRGERAALRRCHETAEVVFLPSFHRLRWSLGQFNPERLALVACVIAHVRHNDDSAHIAAQMAKLKNGDKNSLVSELRFRRLLKIKDRDELLEPMIRIVQLLDKKVNIASLADGIYWWNEYVRKKWAYEYYKNPSKKDKKEVEYE